MTDNTEHSVRLVSRREAMAGTGVALGSLVASGGLTETVMAQSGGPSDEISGIVEDESGPVQGATVVAVPHDTSLAALETTTDASGAYIFEQSDLHEDSNLYHVIARDGIESDPRRGVPNYPFIAAEGFTTPDSVVYQVLAEDFATPWPFEIGGIDMAVNGLTASNGLVSSDGVDDYGLATGPQTLPANNESFGLAFTIRTSTASGVQTYFGCRGESDFVVRSDDSASVDGSVGLLLRHNAGISGEQGIRVASDDPITDGNIHAVVINVDGTTASDVEIYIDGMSSEVSVIVEEDTDWSPSDYQNSPDMGFYAWNQSGSPDFYAEMDAGVFEFNSEPYNQSDREGFVSRRPEV